MRRKEQRHNYAKIPVDHETKVLLPEEISVGQSIPIYQSYPVEHQYSSDEFDEFRDVDNADGGVQQRDIDEFDENSTY